jgi:SagB-type dehydrogenase family enzyme
MRLRRLLTREPGSTGRAASTQAIAGSARSLLPPLESGPLSLEEALRRRRSVREFSARTLTEREIAQLLWAAQGVTDPAGYRTSPSAGALYPLEIYVAIAAGLFRYEPALHRLIQLSREDLRPGMERAALSQEAVGAAAAAIVIAAEPARTAAHYGPVRGRRYVLLEAGHAGQNVLLQATALGLGAVPVGAFDDRAVESVLQLPESQEALYVIAVGEPGGSA